VFCLCGGRARAAGLQLCQEELESGRVVVVAVGPRKTHKGREGMDSQPVGGQRTDNSRKDGREERESFLDAGLYFLRGEQKALVGGRRVVRGDLALHSVAWWRWS